MNICQHRLRAILKLKGGVVQFTSSSVVGDHMKQYYENHVERVNSLEQNIVAKQFFEKAYEIHTKDTNTAQKADDLQVQDAFLSRTPLKDILRTYVELKSLKNLNQYLISNTVYNVGRVFASRQDRLATYWDLDEERLLLHPGFVVLLSDVNRVMHETPIMDLEALFKITQGLLLLRLKDEKIVNNILHKFDTIIAIHDSKEFKLQSDHKLMKIINFFLRDEKVIQSIQTDASEEEIEISALFDGLKQTLQQQRGKFLKLVDALSKVKETYKQLLEIQNNKYVMENVNLNFELLELEEQFVELGLLTMQEVSDKNPNKDPHRRLNKLMNKAVDFMSSGQESTMGMLKTLFNENNEQSQDQIMDLSPELDLSGLSKALNGLAQLLNKSGHHDEMINEEWSDQYQTQNCDYDRGLSTLYMKGLSRFKTYFTQIKTYIESKGIKPAAQESLLLALTFSKIGLFEEANYFKNSVVEDLQQNHKHTDLLHLSEYALLSNTKLDQSLINLIYANLVSNSHLYDDQELSTIALALLYQQQVHKLDLTDVTKIIDLIIQRFQSLESLAELHQDTIDNLQDIQTYCEVAHTKSQSNQLQEILIGSKASTLYSQSQSTHLNPYLLHLTKLFKDTSSLHQQFTRFPYAYQPQIFHYSSNQTIAVIVVPTRYLDNDGLVDGRVLFRSTIMQQFADQQKLDLKIKVLPLSHLFKYDQSTNNWIIAEKDQFRAVLDKVLERTEQDHHLIDLTSRLQKAEDLVQHHLQRNEEESFNDLIYHKLSLDFKQIQHLSSQVSQCVTKYEKAVSLEELKIKSIIYLQTLAKCDDNAIQALHAEINTVVRDICNVVNKFQSVLKEQNQVNISHSQSWIGTLQSQSYGKAEDTLEGFCVSILDSDFYLDTKYCIHRDLQNQLDIAGLLSKSMSQTQNLKTAAASLILYPHLSALGQNQSPSTQLYPHHNHMRKQIQPKFRVDWRDLFKDHPFEQQQDVEDINQFLKQDQESKSNATPSDWFVLNLQNLKAEMKLNFKSHEIVTKILSLDLWDALILEKMSKSTSSIRPIFLTRDPRELLNYNLTKVRQNNSPSMSYLATVTQEKKFLRQLMKHKRSIQRKVQLEAAESRLSQHGAEAVTLRMNKLVEDALKHYKLKGSPFHSSLTFKKQWNFVDIKDVHFDKLKLRTNKKNDDQDLFLSQGNLENYLDIKRSRAEDKLILYKILLRIQSGKQLSKQEKTYLNTQDYQILDYQSNVTSLTISDLSESDQQFFDGFSHSKITDFGSFSLNELILELSQFFDNHTYQEISNRFAHQSKRLEEFDIKAHLLKKTIKHGSHLIVKLQEQQAWAKQSQLDHEEIFRLQEILAVPLQLQSLRPAVQQREREYSQNSLLILNKLGFPQSIITQWISSRQEEIANEQQVDLLNEEPDNHKLWEAMFGCKYAETNQQEISKMVESICQRMFLFKTYQPFFTRRLFTMLIQHPNFTLADRNILASYVEIFKIDFQFTSKDVLGIAQSALKRQNMNVEQTLIDSNYPYLEKLWLQLQTQQKS